MKEYPCKLSKTGQCKYGGMRHYDWGFVSGTCSHCYKLKQDLHYIKKCPLEENNLIKK